MAAHRLLWLAGCVLVASVGCWISGVTAEPLSRKAPTKPPAAAKISQAVPRNGPKPDPKSASPRTGNETPAPIVPPPPENPKSSPGCIVLGDGRVFQGIITELVGGYQIQTQTGIFSFPFGTTRTVAVSLPLAYQQLRESYETPTASDHLDLGRWCEQNGLLEEASLEAQSALVLEPTRTEAIKLLKRTETALGRTIAPPTAVQPTSVSRAVSGVAVVSAETQLEFGRHVERLALNKCGNGGCHGASALSSFKLIKGARSDQNLLAVLKYIDPETPEESPLLTVAQKADGPHAGLFQGSSGTEQYARILAWVVQAAEEQNKTTGVRRRHKEPRTGGPITMIRPQTKNPEEIDEEPTDPPVGPGMTLDSAPEIEIATVAAEGERPVQGTRREAPLKSTAIQKLLQSQAPDAFDPEEFNRLVHGDRPPP